MGLRTPLHEPHVALGVRMVDFGGQDMPLHYSSQVEEHHQVRRDYGVFDVPHMTVVDISNERATACLQHLLANDAARLGETGKALYSAILNEKGGVVDGLIAHLTESDYRVVVNASTRDRGIAWTQTQAAGSRVDLQERDDLAMLVIQGPNARVHSSESVSLAYIVLIREPKPFRDRAEGDRSIACTDHTGGDGLETMLSVAEALDSLNEPVGTGTPPVGLGMRNTPRLEAGLNLYGQDMDESVSLFATSMGWTVTRELAARDFAGRCALEVQKAAGDQPRLAGLVLEERGVLHAHQAVWVAGIGEGGIASGSLSPTLDKSIVLVRTPVAIGDHAETETRGKWYPVRVVQPSSVRHGKPLI